MTRKLLTGLLLSSLCSIGVCGARITAPVPVLPIPSENQIRWQEMEYYAFVHFSLNTYTDQSWGYGTEDINLFNPEKLDCRQWARTCKQAGMKGIIITAKHHSGFCIWPSKYTGYSVKNAPWKNGKGDIVHEKTIHCAVKKLFTGKSPLFQISSLRNIDGNDKIGYAEVDIITQ